VLGEYLALVEKESELSAKAKAAQDALTGKVAAKYGKLTEDDIKTRRRGQVAGHA
jgi:type I restriction enzyme M protein